MKPEDYEQIKRGYAEINLDAIKENVSNMKANISDLTKMILVIKTDGYGHGALPIARTCENIEYVWGYAVATAEEALSLRKGGIIKPILILGYTFPYAYKALIQNDIRPAVFKEDMIIELDRVAKELGVIAPVHVKVDTGMSRIGIRPDDQGIYFVKKLAGLKNLKIEGMFTHFARADELDKSYADKQLSIYDAFVEQLRLEDIDIPIKHCSNSAGIIELSKANKDVVRAGITLYGLWPSDEVNQDIVRLNPVMSLRSHVVYIKKIKAGTSVSYGGTFTAETDRLVATVPLGYGDGYPRGLSNKGYVLINGKKASIIGRVCMDQFMVDITDIDGVKEGDMVTLIGNDGEEHISMEELGNISGRFNYELACDIGKRIPRVYVDHGEVTDIILDGMSIK